MASPERNFRRAAIAGVIGVMCVVAVAVAVAIAEPEDAEAPAAPDAALPAWLESVYPAPGTETSSVSVVEVDYRAGRGSVRLWIDGVDVTSYALPGEGQLHYDPERGRPPVALEAGEHEALVQLVRLPSYGDKHDVIGEFRWTFTVL